MYNDSYNDIVFKVELSHQYKEYIKYVLVPLFVIFLSKKHSGRSVLICGNVCYMAQFQEIKYIEVPLHFMSQNTETYVEFVCNFYEGLLFLTLEKE